jgi:hypothetical protein
MRGVFACRFRAAHLVVKNPRFVGTKQHRASPLELTCDVLPLSVRPLRPNAPSQTCVFSGRIVDSLRSKRFSLRSTHDRRSTRDRRIAPGVRYFGRIMALSRFERFSLRSTHDRRSTRDRRIAPGVRYFGRIMALSRFERFSLRSTHDRRSTRDRRIAPGVRLLRPNHGPAPRQAVFTSVTTISDRLGVCAP